MRKSRRTLNELVIELSQAPARPNICARCNFVFDYPEGAPWSEAFQLVCEHWKVCLADIGEEKAPPLDEDVNGPDIESPSPAVERETEPLPTKRKRSASQSHAGPYRRRKKNVMDKGARRQLIENDPWARNASPKSVDCKGCGRTIKLDKRSDYYPGLWHKHRNKCPAIRRVEDEGSDRMVWLVASGLCATGANVVQYGDAEAEVLRGRARSTANILSSTENLRRRDHRSGWTASSGLRNRSASSHSAGILSRSASPINGRGSHTIATRASALRYPGTRNTMEEISRDEAGIPEIINGENSDDEGYWGGAPFGPGSCDSSDSASGRRLYRYSTRRELLTRYRNGGLQERKASEQCSEEVMQAARCLVSMKSRTSV